jgi:DNA-binding transcriptional MerR regulator
MSTWSVGELATATGLTVRTLHHYDEIGLARPSLRSPAGHRRYTGDDVRRLHRVVALRGFGFGLAEIGALLDGSGPEPRELLQSQLEQVADRIARATRLRDRLGTLLAQFDAAGDPSVAVLIQLIEEMTAVAHTYTPEEFEQMAARRQEMLARLSPEEQAAMAERRRVLCDSLTPEQLAELRRSRPSPPA